MMQLVEDTRAKLKHGWQNRADHPSAATARIISQAISGNGKLWGSNKPDPSTTNITTNGEWTLLKSVAGGDDEIYEIPAVDWVAFTRPALTNDTCFINYRGKAV